MSRSPSINAAAWGVASADRILAAEFTRNIQSLLPMMHFTLFDSGAQRHNYRWPHRPFRRMALGCLYKGIASGHSIVPTLGIKVLKDREN